MVIFFLLAKKKVFYIARIKPPWNGVQLPVTYHLNWQKGRRDIWQKLKVVEKYSSPRKFLSNLNGMGVCHTTMMREKKIYSYVQKALIICILFLNSIKMWCKSNLIRLLQFHGILLWILFIYLWYISKAPKSILFS